jgi:hypothetical protein
MDADERIDPLDKLMAEDLDPVPPPAPGTDGLPFPTGMNFLPEPIPEATPENLVCLRGPCRHYVEITTRFQSGNTKGTLDHVPRQINRYCNVLQSEHIDLTDEAVLDCSHWYPESEDLIQVRKKAREEYAAAADKA